MPDVRRALCDCLNPRCARYVTVPGLVCCQGCRMNLSKPEANPLAHNTSCDDRFIRYVTLLRAAQRKELSERQGNPRPRPASSRDSTSSDAQSH